MNLPPDGTFTVYKHTTPNGKVYIGITSKPAEERWLNGRGYSRNAHFMKAIKKYGWDNITHEIIETDLSKTAACDMEQRLIKEFDATNPEKGYNATSGGEHYTPTEATRERLRQAHLGRRYNLGVPFTEERKRHLSENHADVRGEKNPNYGKKWTPEQLAVRQAHRVYATGGDNPTARAILQYDKGGNFIKRWGSIADAGRAYNRTSVKDCLSGKYKTGCGYVWKYEKEVKEDAV